MSQEEEEEGNEVHLGLPCGRQKNNHYAFEIRNSRALGATSRVVLELKPFGISIRGLIGSKPWVGRSIGKISRNSSTQYTRLFFGHSLKISR